MVKHENGGGVKHAKDPKAVKPALMAAERRQQGFEDRTASIQALDDSHRKHSTTRDEIGAVEIIQPEDQPAMEARENFRIFALPRRAFLFTGVFANSTVVF